MPDSKHLYGNIFLLQLQFCLHFSLNKKFAAQYKSRYNTEYYEKFGAIEKIAPFLLEFWQVGYNGYDNVKQLF